MKTAPAEPPCVCVMRTPGALPYMAEAKLAVLPFQFVCTDGTDGIADTFRVFFDTHCRYYDFFQLLGIFAECNLQVALLFSFCQVISRVA